MKKNKIFPLIIIVSAILGLIVSLFLLFSYQGINIFSLTGNSIKNIGSSSSSESNSGFDDFTELKDYNDAIIENNPKPNPSSGGSSGGGGGSSSVGSSSGGGGSSDINSDDETSNEDYTDSDENNEEYFIEQSYS